MKNFWLIQRGCFQETGECLTGKNGLVVLDYMGAAEFEWGAIPKAFRRLLYYFDKYITIHTGIYTPEQDELLIFCNEDYAHEVSTQIYEFIKKPWNLKEFSELEKVPNASKSDNSWNGRRSNFWWCIDKSYPYGDWMAFLSSDKNKFLNAITTDYNEWWLKKPIGDREDEYLQSCY